MAWLRSGRVLQKLAETTAEKFSSSDSFERKCEKVSSSSILLEACVPCRPRGRTIFSRTLIAALCRASQRHKEEIRQDCSEEAGLFASPEPPPDEVNAVFKGFCAEPDVSFSLDHPW